MATFGSSVRRGLPRVPGGEPWPPAGAAPGANGNGAGPAAEVAATQVAQQGNSDSSTPRVAARGSRVADDHPVPQSVVAGAQEDAAPKVTAEPRGAVTLRRGLPRVPGG